MKLFGGYIKRKLEDTNLLLAGGGHKSLLDFIGSLQWDDLNRKLQYKSASATTWTDLVAFGSNAMSSTSYLPLTGGTITNGSNWAAINFSRTGVGSGTVGGIDVNGLYFMHQDSAGTSSISMYLKAGEGLSVGGTKVSLEGHTHDYLPLGGGTLTGTLTINSTSYNSYNEGLRITRAANNWAGITFGSTGTSGAPTGGWFVATNPSNQFIINPDNSTNDAGLCLNKGGDLKWRNTTVSLDGHTHNYAGSSSAGGHADFADKLYYATTSYLATKAAIDDFEEAYTFKCALWNGNANEDNLSTSFPGADNGIILSGGWANTSYGFQLAIDDDPNYFMALRQRRGGTWYAWKRIPMGDGTGASGTWGISITGSADTATNLANNPSILAGTSNTSAIIVTAGGKTSSEFVVPYATSANSASLATNILPENSAHYFRDPTNATWRGGMYWGTNGYESLSFIAAHASTRFLFVCGSDIASWLSNTYLSATCALEITSTGTTAPGFIKKSSSDDYLLSGGGGHKHVALLVKAPATQSAVNALQSTYTFWYVERNADQTLGFASGHSLVVGLVLTVLVKNTGSTTIKITVPDGWDSLDGSSLSVAAGKLLEISILCYASSKYLVSSKGQ